MNFIDLTQYRCPLPLVRVKLALKQMHSGEQLHVLLSDPGSRQDVPGFLKKHGHGVEELANDPRTLALVITKAGAA